MSLSIVFGPLEAKADPAREFILSCSYGVLAGSLVGAASLAFSDQPGNNLQMIARGASLGLYAGIALGLFVVYGAGPEDDDAAAAAAAGVTSFKPPKLQVYPLIGARGFEGAAANYSVLEF